MTQNIINSLHDLAERYKKHGVTVDMLIMLAKKAPPELSELAVITGIRMLLVNEYGTSETFTVEQVAACTGETPAEVRTRIKAEGIKVIHSTSRRTHKPS